MRQVLRIPNARIYLFGDVVSTLGDTALWLAMAIWVKELTGSSAGAGLVIFAALVLLIVLVHHRSQIWLIYLVIFLYSVIGSAIGPAQTALLPALVPEELLAQANGVQQTLNQGLRLVAPLLGAGLFALAGGPVAAEIDAVTFTVAVASLALLRVDEAGPQRAAAGPGTPGERGKFTAGFRFIGGEPALRSITAALAIALLVFGFTESAAYSVVTIGLHHAASFVGVLMTIQGVGAVIGGLTAAALLKRVSEGMLIAIALCFASAAVLLLTLPDIVTAVTGMVLAGLVGPWVAVAATTAIQRRTPAPLIGRVTGAFRPGPDTVTG